MLATAEPKSLPTDERMTPRWFYRLCSEVFGPFDLDACAARWNAQCRRYVTKEQDIFRRPPASRASWRNPPYSRGNLDRHLGHSRELVLLRRWGRSANLVPADTSTDWWKRHVVRPEGGVVRCDWLHQHYPVPLGNAVRFVSHGLLVTVVYVGGRLAFDGPDGPVGGDADNPRSTGAMQPSALVVYDRPDVRTKQEGRP